MAYSKRRVVKRQIKRHVPYRKLLVPAIQWWNPQNKRNNPTSAVRIINWIQRYGNCGDGPQSFYGRKCIRRALTAAVKSGHL